MKKTILFFALAAVVSVSFAQKKKTTTSATISFDATTKADDKAKGDNKTVVASLNPKSGEVAFEAIIKSFSFANPMMQEHFNSVKWMDSEKFAKSTFKGKISNLKAINFKKDGTYNANIEGSLTMHGITKNITTTATIVVSKNVISTKSIFTIKLADYVIGEGQNGMGHVATEPKVTVVADFK